MFEFFKIMWIMRRIDETYLKARVAKKQIDQEAYEQIIDTPQVPIK